MELKQIEAESNENSIFFHRIHHGSREPFWKPIQKNRTNAKNIKLTTFQALQEKCKQMENIRQSVTSNNNNRQIFQIDFKYK
jgi:hypothetical protein